MSIPLTAIAYVENQRQEVRDDYWGKQLTTICLTAEFSPAALQGLEAFSHVEILFLFHQVQEQQIQRAARHPRNNPAWPEVGIFAQRAKNRPNRLGSTICRLIKVDGTSLTVAELDAINGTPILDIKPVMREFLPREAVTQPAWCSELMRDYWLTA